MPLFTAAVSVASTATLIYAGDKGSFQAPQRLILQNQDSTKNIYFGGADVTATTAPYVAPGGSVEVPLEAGEALYAIVASGSASAAYLVTRH